MTNINAGIVSIEDGAKKAEEYAPPRKVRVELHFDVPEGTDAVAQLDAVAALADKKVKALLGAKAPAERVITPNATVQEKDAAKAAYVDKVEAPKKPPTRTKIKADEALPGEPTVEEAVAPTPKKDSLDDLLGEAEPEPIKEVTDKELGDAARKAAGKSENGPVLVRQLIKSFNVEKVSLIPQDQRGGFLLKLAALDLK